LIGQFETRKDRDRREQVESLPYFRPAVIVFQSSAKKIKVSSDFEYRPYSAACNNGTDSKSHLGLIPVTQFPCVSESIHAYGYSTNLLHLSTFHSAQDRLVSGGPHPHSVLVK
jgi:hypothetical protein